jgi:uncharacterized protein YbjT (DUF2867 family)
MKLLIIGSTGRTRRHLLQLALEKGYVANAIVRDAKKVKLTSDRLKLFEEEWLTVAFYLHP